MVYIHGGIIGQVNKFYSTGLSMDRSGTGFPYQYTDERQYFSLHILIGFDKTSDKTFTYLNAMQDKFCFVIIPPCTVMYINNYKIRHIVNTYCVTNERADAYL